MSYTERAFATTDEAEIKRLREYLAALKAELARVRSLDPVERWWDEIGRIQKKIDALLDYSPTVRPPEQTAQLAVLEAELNNALEQLDYWQHPRRQIDYTPAEIEGNITYWQAEITRIEGEIDEILALPITSGLTEAQKEELTRLYAERDWSIFQYRLAREPKRDGKMATDPSAWEDITGDVVWNQTDFTQVARTGPGSFTITLKGSHPEFRAGEEIHLEVDGIRSFGGWVARVERGYFFEDFSAPRTVLHGTDYNIMFDRLAVRNYPWEYSASRTRSRMMMGTYRNWPDFPQGSIDADMIEVVFQEYLLPDLPLAFDYTGGVDAVSTPAPVAPWAMPTPGSALRLFMQSVSQITSAVWCIDATMQLQYHDREGPPTAPFPLTDGLGGISSRNLKVTTKISNMVNDVLVWGTLAKKIEGEIMVWHEQGDLGFWERYWISKISQTQALLNKLLAISPSKRTAKQKKAITTYRSRITTYKERLADARAREWDPLSGDPRPENAIVNSIDTWGRWQGAEFREDIHHQEWLQIRGHSILTRLDEPIVQASATIWDPGYQAGQVVHLKSSVHGIDANLPIRSVHISFTVAKEPHDGFFYALPRYDLEMGLDPEAPWNIYDYLPYPGEGTPGLGGDTSGG